MDHFNYGDPGLWDGLNFGNVVFGIAHSQGVRDQTNLLSLEPAVQHLGVCFQFVVRGFVTELILKDVYDRSGQDETIERFTEQLTHFDVDVQVASSEAEAVASRSKGGDGAVAQLRQQAKVWS